MIFSIIRKLYLHRAVDLPAVEKKFISLQLITACYMAFAHGSNDVANAVGPLAAALKVMGVIGSEIPVWILVVGGLGMVIGMATGGYKVVETIGSKITELTPTRVFLRSLQQPLWFCSIATVPFQFQLLTHLSVRL